MMAFSGGPYECILWITPANMAMNILGMPVYADYYSMHDPKKGTVDWAPHYKSPKSDVVRTGRPSKDK